MTSHTFFYIILLSAFWTNVLSGPSYKLGGNPLPDTTLQGNLQKRDSVPAGYHARPYYPTPKGGWDSNWKASYAKAEAVVSNMTLAEKVNMTSGVGYLMVGFKFHNELL